VHVSYAVVADPTTRVDALRGCVRDTGPGIAAEDLPHLFTAFWRGDRRDRKGAGLGLWIASAICEAHGGELRVETERGVGSAFHFVLPLADTTRRSED
jgi:signal transduction histidine kinase